MQWMVPKSKLDQDQEFIINQCTTNKQSCCWIQGIAGSGKTVILVYALETLRINNPTRSMCFVTFTHALKDLVRTGLSNQTKNLPILTVDQFIRNNKPYDIVLVDEIQDLPLVKVDKIKSLSGKLVVAGDMDQSIYPGGIQNNEINQILKPETHKLSVLYRLTENLQFLARSLLPTTSIYAAKVASRRNTEVVLAHALNPKEETDWVVERAIMLAKPGSPSLIILPRHDDIIDFIEAVADLKNKKRPERVYEETKYNTNKPKLDYGSINNSLRDVELPIRYLGNSFGSLDEADQKPLTFIMTYHSAKGLDFEHVFLPRMNSTVRLWRDDNILERRLFFVGITRSRENLFISYSTADPHPLVNELPKQFMQIKSCEKSVFTNGPDDDEYLF